eukprot:2153491-Prorocentrum_lima.AAC.1
MTSSLVGSEMCIRDSRCPSVHHGQALQSCVVRLYQFFQQGHQCGAGAVSYTHLTLPTICSV